jgi:hypothetical protein
MRRCVAGVQARSRAQNNERRAGRSDQRRGEVSGCRLRRSLRAKRAELTWPRLARGGQAPGRRRLGFVGPFVAANPPTSHPWACPDAFEALSRAMKKRDSERAFCALVIDSRAVQLLDEPRGFHAELPHRQPRRPERPRPRRQVPSHSGRRILSDPCTLRANHEHRRAASVPATTNRYPSTRAEREHGVAEPAPTRPIRQPGSSALRTRSHRGSDMARG